MCTLGPLVCDVGITTEVPVCVPCVLDMLWSFWWQMDFNVGKKKCMFRSPSSLFTWKLHYGTRWNVQSRTQIYILKEILLAIFWKPNYSQNSADAVLIWAQFLSRVSCIRGWMTSSSFGRGCTFVSYADVILNESRCAFFFTEATALYKTLAVKSCVWNVLSQRLLCDIKLRYF